MQRKTSEDLATDPLPDQSKQESDAHDPNITNTTNQDHLEDKQYIFTHTTKDWHLVTKLLAPIIDKKATLPEILETINTLSRNFTTNTETDTKILDDHFKHLSKEETTEYETNLFPGIARLATQAPSLFTKPLTILSEGKSAKVRLSKDQCACLLAQMFMCVVLDQHNKKLPRTYNFSEMFTENKSRRRVLKQKLICILHYFKRVLADKSEGFVVFDRLVHRETLHGKHDIKEWRTCEAELTDMEMRPKGKIEDAEGSLEVDFANKFLGGGVLRTGAAQEEIQFITSPEHLVGLLFCECMTNLEAVLIEGAEIYCSYQGYLDNFVFSSDYKDKRAKTASNTLDRHVIAIDALNFRLQQTMPQFSEAALLREINKAYIGFYGSYSDQGRELLDKVVSTGKWGCGAFQGDTHLKLLIQWIAASRAGRNMVFYSFDDKKGLHGVERVLKYYKGKKVGELMSDVLECIDHLKRRKKEKAEVFEALIVMNNIPVYNN